MVDSFSLLIRKLISWLDVIEPYEPIEIFTKDDCSIVTNFDLIIQSKIKELLSELIPDAILVSEENNVRSSAELSNQIILIDPIDGTENFASGLPFWGIGLAHFIDMQLKATCVLFPEILFYHASKDVDLGARSNYRNLRTSSSKNRNYLHPANFEREFLAKNAFGGQDRILGCSLLNISLACLESWTFKSSGPGLRAWDFLPAILPALENDRLIYVNDEPYTGKFLQVENRYKVQITSSDRMADVERYK
jgi:myo-inositol-1(or 4)-monophosphatase